MLITCLLNIETTKSMWWPIRAAWGRPRLLIIHDLHVSMMDIPNNGVCFGIPIGPLILPCGILLGSLLHRITEMPLLLLSDEDGLLPSFLLGQDPLLLLHSGTPSNRGGSGMESGRQKVPPDSGVQSGGCELFGHGDDFFIAAGGANEKTWRPLEKCGGKHGGSGGGQLAHRRLGREVKLPSPASGW